MNGDRYGGNTDLKFATIERRRITPPKHLVRYISKWEVGVVNGGGDSPAFMRSAENALLTTLWNHPITAGLCDGFNRIASSRC